MDNEELVFLREELNKINQQIKNITYGGSKDIVEAQIKLWELRDLIKVRIRAAEGKNVGRVN
jgi:hypothetical protein